MVSILIWVDFGATAMFLTCNLEVMVQVAEITSLQACRGKVAYM